MFFRYSDYSLGRGWFDVGPSRGPKCDRGSSRGGHGGTGPADDRPCRYDDPMAFGTCAAQSGSQSTDPGHTVPSRYACARSQSRFALRYINRYYYPAGVTIRGGRPDRTSRERERESPRHPKYSSQICRVGRSFSPLHPEPTLDDTRSVRRFGGGGENSPRCALSFLSSSLFLSLSPYARRMETTNRIPFRILTSVIIDRPSRYGRSKIRRGFFPD